MSVEKMGEYVAEELKKVKFSLFAFQLIRVPIIRNAFFGSLNDATPSKSSQDAFEKKVTFSTPKCEPMMREVVGKAQISQPTKDQGKQVVKDLAQV